MGTIKFTNRGQSIETDFCEPNLNLLAHAQALEIGIGSRCGGHGACGGDVVRVWVQIVDAASEGTESPLSAVTEAEREHLSSEQIAMGYRLACQCYPNKKGLHLKVEAKIESQSTS